MKKVKSLLSAICIVSIVTSALAFTGKLFTPGNVWCFPAGSPPNPNEWCSSQPGGLHLNVNTVTSGGTTANPCPTNYSPYIHSGNTCLTPAVGTEYMITEE